VVQYDQRRTSLPKVRATLYLPADLLEEARDAAVYLAGYPVRLTLTKLAEDALRAELRRLKDAHNGGRDFPPRTEDLKGGRPIAA
jgi:post-segregation antitoxin (ccd killing protein)